MGKRGLLILLVGVMMLISLGCSKKKPAESAKAETTVVPEREEATDRPSPKEEALPEENHEGQARSRLTGLWVEEEIAERRPVALMINNIAAANPQTGTQEASILYEAVVEGGITRLMGIYEEITGDRIGSVRSARHYFVSFADEYDAIYAHFGQTKWATSKIKELNVDNLSGLEAIGSTVYYRDNSIKAPHNAFASAKGILEGIEKKGYRTSLRDDLNNHFTFYDQDTDLKDGENASEKVTLAFSGYTSPYFIYDKEKKLYCRYQFNGPHIDKGTKEPLCFKNLIIQYVPYWTIDKKHNYQSMDIENASGKGLYITNGKAESITWDKKEATKEMHYYDRNGKLLTINPGKTYIAIYPESRISSLQIK